MKKTYKIIFSIYDSLDNPYYAGGGARTVHEIAKRLAKKYSIVVMTGNFKGAVDRKRDNVQYIHIGPSFFGPKISQLIFQLLLPFYSMKERYDVWVESFSPPFTTSFLPYFSKKPIIGFVQMLAAEDMERKYKLPFRYIERAGLKMYQYIIVLTEDSLQKIKKVNKKSLCVLFPNGIEAFPSTISTRKGKHFLYLGRIELNQKGLDLLLEAYALIEKKSSSPLVIAGSGTAIDEKLLKDKITSLGLEKRVILTGRVEGKEKEQLLRDSIVVIIPSRFDTFGLIALEAMAYGKPIVCFAIDGFKWIPGSVAVKVKPFSIKQLSTALLKSASDEELQKIARVHGRKEVKKYTWDSLIDAYEQEITGKVQRRIYNNG